MTDTSRTHYGAIGDRLDELTGPPCNYQVFLGGVKVPDAALKYPYLIVWPSPGDYRLLTLAGQASAVDTTTQVTAVGRDVDEVLAALDRAAVRLNGFMPEIDGRRCSRVTKVPADPYIRESDDVHTGEGQATYEGIGQYQLTSTPIPSA